VSDLTRPTTADLAALHPDVRARVEAMIADLRGQGCLPLVFETARSPERAAYLASIGRSQAGTASLHVPRSDGLARAADVVDGRRDEHGRLLLWGGAFPGDPPDISARREAAAADYFRAQGAAAARAGLTWGGSWRSFRDPAHVELA